MNKLLLTLFLSILSFVFFVTKVDASFVENFNEKTVYKNWDIINGESLSFNKSIMHMPYNAGANCPYLVTKNVVFPQEGSYSFEVKFAYPYSGYYGNGIFAGYKNSEGTILNPFSIWNVSSRNQIEIAFWHENFNIPWDANYHTVKLVFNRDPLSVSYQGSLSFYIDGKLMYFAPVYDRKFELVELGHRPFAAEAYDWSDLSINYLKILY